MRRTSPFLIALFLSFSASAQSDYDAAIVDYVGLKYPCDGEVVPTLRIQNQGTNTMFTCVVETWKNGVFDNSFNWVLTTAAPTGAVRQPSLPPMVGLVQGDTLEFRIIDVNGVPDQGPGGNIRQVPLDVVPDPANNTTLLVEVTTDTQPWETSWTLGNAAGQMVAQGGGYAQPYEVDSVWVTTTPGECLMLRVSDAGGDGMAGGSVRVHDAGGLVSEVDGASFTDAVDRGVVAGMATGLATELYDEPSIGYAPVPTTGPVTVTFAPRPQVPETLELLDATGRVIRVVRGSSLSGGIVQLDLSGESEGVFLLRSRFADGRARTGRIIVAR